MKHKRCKKPYGRALHRSRSITQLALRKLESSWRQHRNFHQRWNGMNGCNCELFLSKEEDTELF